MSLIPGATGLLPGVYGPSDYHVKMIDGKYYIGPIEHERYKPGPWYYGTPREIAKTLIVQCAKYIFRRQDSRDMYLYPFRINLEKETVCHFTMGASGVNGIDPRTVAKEIEQELDKLRILIPFG